MKPTTRGRALDVALNTDQAHTANSLMALGFTKSRAEDVAAAAVKYSELETENLVRQLIPRSVWPGIVVAQRHFVEGREAAWLLLKYDGKGWKLDSALFA